MIAAAEFNESEGAFYYHILCSVQVKSHQCLYDPLYVTCINSMLHVLTQLTG